MKLLSVLAIFGVLATGSLLTAPSATAATKYPSWSEVVKAKHNAKLKQKELKKITAIVKALDAKVAATQKVATAKGLAYGTAQDAYYQAAISEQALDKQAQAAEKIRKESEAQAGQLAAQLARNGSNGFQLNLFLNGKDASNLLDSIGDAGKISERANGIDKQAVQDRNTAQALTDQAKVAKTILANLKIVAENAYKQAQAAATTAADALQESTTHKSELEAQYKALTTEKNLTEKKYLKGLKVKYGITGGLSTEISSSGWARPTIGVITAGFGMRVNPVDGGYRLHTGTDIADGCGVPIYAAHGGQVTYSGVYGDLGNFIQIQATGEYANGYGHIEAGGLLVRAGDYVHVGQLIARTGATGEATGCHLHFMVIQNGVPINPVPFMRGKGIVLG